MDLHMLECTTEQGLKTDEGVTGGICVAGHHLHACKNVCAWLYVCVDEGLEKGGGI